jgi:hypothetical protein
MRGAVLTVSKSTWGLFNRCLTTLFRDLGGREDKYDIQKELRRGFIIIRQRGCVVIKARGRDKELFYIYLG